MFTLFANRPQPAWRFLRFSVALSIVGVVAFLLIFTLPRGWASRWELDWYLFWTGTSISCLAIVLALVACAVRGAEAAVGSALAILGLNVITFLVVVLMLFSFRMGAP